MTHQTPEMQTALIAAASACLAAGIAGMVSILGLLISKEQEVSRFRQTWIDDFRKDIAEVVARIYQIHSYFHKSLSVDDEAFDYPTFWNATREDYLELNRASVRIKLRVNREECESQLILRSMEEIETLFTDDLGRANPDLTLAQIHKLVSALETDMPPLLKKEWRRVKSGERVYRVAKIGALVIFSIAGSASVALLVAVLIRANW